LEAADKFIDVQQLILLDFVMLTDDGVEQMRALLPKTRLQIKSSEDEDY
jgi:hypothetical protein